MGTFIVIVVSLFVGAFGWNKYGGDMEQIYSASKNIVTTIKKDGSNTINTITEKIKKLNEKLEKENKTIAKTTNQHPRYKN